MKHGDWYWHELMTAAPEKAAPFYEGLFGWKTTEWQGGVSGEIPYKIWVHGENDAHGGMMKMEGPKFENIPAHWMIYIKTDDADRDADKIPALGGQIVVPPQDIPNVGRMVIAADPTGAHFGLLQPIE